MTHGAFKHAKFLQAVIDFHFGDYLIESVRSGISPCNTTLTSGSSILKNFAWITIVINA